MSMSQEEIESLMNGLDISGDESPVEEEETSASMSEDDINDLIVETQNIQSQQKEEDVETVDDILASIEATETSPNDLEKEESVDVAINNVVDEPIDEKDLNITDNNIQVEKENTKKETKKVNNGVSHEELTEQKINAGIFPFPADSDSKVVTQLNEVANDAEEKAGQIFDVLSNILEYNDDMQTNIQKLNTFNKTQIAMLNSLSKKFPEINIFTKNLEDAKEITQNIDDISKKINEGNNEIFSAMELMQFHDIHRQKIERVMSVIKKLSSYLNNIFEDENPSQELVVAKHISGDNTNNLVDEADLDSLIAEFSK